MMGTRARGVSTGPRAVPSVTTGVISVRGATTRNRSIAADPIPGATSLCRASLDSRLRLGGIVSVISTNRSLRNTPLARLPHPGASGHPRPPSTVGGPRVVSAGGVNNSPAWGTPRASQDIILDGWADGDSYAPA